MKPNFMDYLEFEFWWMRFSSGNFDIEYDRSQDPKYRTITDLPVHLFQKICENLGENYQNEYRFTLRRVCKSFRALADSWIPEFKKVSVFWYDDIEVSFDEKVRYYNYKDVNEALSDVISIIAHPKYEFESFGVDGDSGTRFLKKIVQELESRKLKIQVYHIHLNFRTWKDQILLSPFYQAETVKMVYIEEWTRDISKFMEEICESDQEEQPGSDEIQKIRNLKPKRILFSRMEITLRRVLINDVTKIIKNLLQFSNLKYCLLKSALLFTESGFIDQSKVYIERFGAKIQEDRPDILHYPIPNSNDFFEIEVQTNGIRIERKSA
ncbi:unnamed protein product [Caenorhabditis nigoni]